MKVLLDLGALVASGQLTEQEAERLKGLAAKDTGALGVNILFGLGATAVAVGIGILLPTPQTVIALGAMLFFTGFGMRFARIERWAVFAQIIMLIGALALMGSIGTLYGDILWVRVAMTAGLTVAAVTANSGLLASLAVLGFAATITFDADRLLPTHFLVVAIISLSALVLALYLLSKRLTPAQERLAVIAMRTGIILVNIAFLLGSMNGDDMAGVSHSTFAIAWAIALLAFGAWAMFANRRWVVNSVAVFGTIHFIVQWFTLLGAQPVSIVGGGLVLIGVGLALARFNNWLGNKS